MSEARRPRILLVTRNYPPLTGGMERLMQRASEGLVEWSDLTIVGPEGSSEYAPDGVATFEAPASLLGFFSLGTWEALKACRQEDFDMIIGGSGLVAPILWMLKSCFKLPTAVFIHGLDIVIDNPVYQALFIPTIRRADLLIANSKNTRKLAAKKGVREDRITVINPGTDLPDLDSIMPKNQFKARYNIHFDQILLFTGRITRRKGLSRFIERSLPDVLRQFPDAGLLVVGDNPNDSLDKRGEAHEVNRLVESMNLKEKVQFLGQVSHEDLLAAYKAADVQVFPLISVPGDVEGFGMVAIEAAACGTPTVAFREGGVEDAVSDDNGLLLNADQGPNMSGAIAYLIAAYSPDSETCRNHARKFEWCQFSAKLKDTLAQLLGISPALQQTPSDV